MLILVKYVGAHEGRTVLAVKCSNGEIIPLICDAAEEEAEYQMLCQTAIDDVAQNGVILRGRWPWTVTRGVQAPPGVLDTDTLIALGRSRKL